MKTYHGSERRENDIKYFEFNWSRKGVNTFIDDWIFITRFTYYINN